MLAHLGQCLRKGCVICIEHASAVLPRYTRWELWAKPCCYDGNLHDLYAEIERCKKHHGDRHIRLTIDDFAWRSRMSLVVHRPAPAV